MTGGLLGARCPRLRKPGHGSWYFSVEFPRAGARRRLRRGGFGSKAAAQAALEALRAPVTGPAPGISTKAWLERWLASRMSLRASTWRGYAAHVRGYLNPYLGRIPLVALAPADVQAMFAAIIGGHAAGRSGCGSWPSPCSTPLVWAIVDP